jgi:hypothetical protein
MVIIEANEFMAYIGITDRLLEQGTEKIEI